MKELIKVDSKNKLRYLRLYQDGPVLRRMSGLLGGKLVETNKTCKPKNLGKSNETTAEAQVLLEITSEANKKLDEGYVFIPEDHENYTDDELIAYIEENRIMAPSPMLAKPYAAKYADFQAGVLVSPKLDGMRCLAVVTEDKIDLWTRGAKKIETMDHIITQLEELRRLTGWTGILDGELYQHSDEDNFQEIMKAIKKYRKGISEKVVYNVYDILDTSKKARDRAQEYLNLIAKSNYLEDSNIAAVEQRLALTEEEVNKSHAYYLSEGYEGTMVKNANSLYKESRSSNLLKLKDFSDYEFEVIDVVPMDNYPEQGKYLCRRENGIEFTATPKSSHEERKSILLNKDEYIGQMMTVTFFGFTDEGKPRFPIAKGIRLAEDVS